MRRNIELRKLCDKTRVTAGIQINYNLKLVCFLTRFEQELAGGPLLTSGSFISQLKIKNQPLRMRSPPPVPR